MKQVENIRDLLQRRTGRIRNTLKAAKDIEDIINNESDTINLAFKIGYILHEYNLLHIISGVQLAGDIIWNLYPDKKLTYDGHDELFRKLNYL